MLGIELKQPIAAEVKGRCLDAGYLIGSVGTQTLRLLPPLIIERTEIDAFVTDFRPVFGGGCSPMKHFISLNDPTTEEILDLLDLADTIKADVKVAGRTDPPGQNPGPIFAKVSTRTWVSF